MGRLLWKKMLRDMKRSFVTYGLCVLIVAIGFCGYSVLMLCGENLMDSRDAFLRDTDFCDGFAEVSEAPASRAGRLALIDGVEMAQGRLVKNARVDGYEEEVELRLVSWKEGDMNRPSLSAGALPRPGRREIVIGSGIAEARGIRTGDALVLNIGGRPVTAEVCGIGLTPENIYMIKEMSDLYPDPSCYDAGFMSYDTMEQLFDMQGKVNSFLIRTSSFAAWEDVKEPVEEMLKSYGCQSAYSRDDQQSINMVNTEIEQLARMSGIIPFLFLFVAAVILYITLSRLMEQQRTQVGTLMALGIPIKRIQRHYMCYGLFTGILGGAAGSVMGYLSADPMAGFYRMYFRLPEVTAPLSPAYLFQGVLMSAVFCAGTAWIVAGSLGRLTPAQALRPAAPKAAKKSWLEKVPGFTSLFTVPGLMAVRSLARNKRRTALSLAGISFAYMITATLVSLNSMFDVFLFDYWEKTQRQDIMVQFDRPVKAGDALDAVRGPQVMKAEGVMEFPVTLYGPEGKTDCSIQAVAQDSTLCILYTAEGRQVHTEEEGIVLSEHMAGLLGVGAGDSIAVKVSTPEERMSRVHVTAVIAQYMGSTAYMSHEGAGRISEYRDVYSGVLLSAPPGVREELTGRLKEAPRVSLVESRRDRLDKYHSMMGSMSAIMASMSMMGVLIGFAVVYISSLISFEELKWELSTLMMLGLKSGECLDVISTSQWLLAVGAVILGIPLTMAMSRLISVSMASDLYTIPDFVDGKSLLQAIGLTAVSVGLSSFMMLRKLKKMSPAELLRERE